MRYNVKHVLKGLQQFKKAKDCFYSIFGKGWTFNNASGHNKVVTSASEDNAFDMMFMDDGGASLDVAYYQLLFIGKDIVLMVLHHYNGELSIFDDRMVMHSIDIVKYNDMVNNLLRGFGTYEDNELSGVIDDMCIFGS